MDFISKCNYYVSFGKNKHFQFNRHFFKRFQKKCLFLQTKQLQTDNCKLTTVKDG